VIIDGNKKVGGAEVFKTPREMALHNLNLAKDRKIDKLKQVNKKLSELVTFILDGNVQAALEALKELEEK